MLAQPSISYALVTKGTPKNNSSVENSKKNNPLPNSNNNSSIENSNPKIFSKFKDLAKELFGTDFNSLVTKIQTFMDTYKNKSPKKQKIAYLDLLDDLLHHGL
jgi:hypothetical protein